MSPNTRTVVLPLAMGDLLEGRWRIDEQIGRGAMGTVFAAWDVEEHRKVAVKILAPERCRDPEFVARFEREAQLLSTIDHPNVVSLRAVGRRGALPYLVMAFVEGMSLGELLEVKGGRLDPEPFLEVMRQICAGLAAMHQRGLVHRDLKPANVIVGNDGHVTLLDLSVARNVREPVFTRPGQTMGTPFYMAPEQIDGRGDVDARADIYALGALAFELLTGRPPYQAATEHEVLRQHKRAPVPSATQVHRSVPLAVSEVLRRALAKSPAERFKSVPQLLEALETAFSQAPTLPFIDLSEDTLTNTTTGSNPSLLLHPPRPTESGLPTVIDDEE